MKMNRNGLADIVKFLASVCIMSGHYSYVLAQEYQGLEITKMLPVESGLRLSGCVALFFVISGYYTAGSFQKMCTTTVNIEKTFKKRLSRFMPLMWISIAAFLAASVMFLVRNGHWWGGRNCSLSEIILTCMGIHAWAQSGSYKINGPIWYISILILNTLLYLLISTEKISKKHKIMLFILMFSLGLGTYKMKLKFPLLSEKPARSYMSFFFGVLLRLVIDKAEKKKDISVQKAVFGTIGIIVAVFFLLAERKTGMKLLGDRVIIYTMLLTPALILLGETRLFANPLFINKVTAFLGKISFSVFLIHIPCLIMLCLLVGKSMLFDSYRAYGMFLGMTFVAALIMDILDTAIRRRLSF